MLSATWEHSLVQLADPSDNYRAARSGLFASNPDALTSAHQYCRDLTAYHSRSFFMASGLLPQDKRQAVRALYAFCRTVDDIVDEGEGDVVSELALWRDWTLGYGPATRNPIVLAWRDAIARYDIPLIYAEQLIDGVMRDLVQTRYQSFDDLKTYCYGVASTVGLMSMHIIGFQAPEAVRYAVKLGVALQLTNILRDVGEDEARNRLYLPLDELEAFRLSNAELSAQKSTEAWRSFMQFQIARARHIYDEAWPGINLLNPEGRMAIGAAATFYRDILSDIEAHNYDVFNRRARVTKWGKLRRVPTLWWEFRR